MTFRKKLRELAPGLLIVAAIGIFWTFGYNGLWHRLRLDVEGHVTARQDFPQTRYTHGPQTVYSLQRSDGSAFEYTATQVDPSLPRTIPIGAYIAKREWDVSYLLNGERVDDFPIIAYVASLVVGLACSIGAGVLLVRERLQAGTSNR
jgi:hypothetical protein